MIVAITGYIGSGKTTVAKIFEENGFSQINVDRIGHELLKDNSIKDKIVAEFGMELMTRDLEVDREKLSDIVFKDDAKLEILDKIVHPYIEKELKESITSEKNIVIDVALFNELKVRELCSKTILIKSDIGNVYERLRERYSKEEVLNVMNSQNILHTADYVIENNGTLEELRQAALKLVNELKT